MEFSTSVTDEHSQQPLYELVYDDKFYQEVEARLEDPNERDNGGRTLLHLAAWSWEDNPKILQLLLDRGADVNAVTPEGYTPLLYAVCTKKRRKVAALLDAGANVNSKDNMGRSVLHFATNKSWYRFPNPIRVFACNMSILKTLLSHPEINPNPVDNRRQTPLMWAVQEKNCDALKALLKKGANPNIPRRGNETPLHVALSADVPSYTIVESLLTYGADIYCKDESRLTPIDILIQNAPLEATLQFASRCLELIAFRYQIRESLRRQLRWNPKLSNLLEKCCEEVKLMREVRVHAKFTLHDFALDCFQARVENPMTTIFVPLVEALLTGLFSKYFSFILYRISVQDLRRILERTIGRKAAINLVSNDASRFDIYDAIRDYYEENEVLKDRILNYREFLLKKI